MTKKPYILDNLFFYYFLYSIARFAGILEPSSYFCNTCIGSVLARRFPVWGVASAKERITVKICGQDRPQPKAGKDGKWMLNLGPLQGSKIPGNDY